MLPPPFGWPRLSATLFYDGPAAPIDFLERPLGFVTRLRVPPRGASAGKVTGGLFLYVDDIEAHHATAVAAGAQVFRALETTDYGAEYWSDRGYGATDPEGQRWWFAQRLRG